MSNYSIEVKDLVFRYSNDQKKPTINRISFKVNSGEWLAVIGPNGSGKSTLAKLIDGLLKAESGEIRVGGLTLTEESVWDVRQKIGFVFQNPDNQFVGATVEDDVAFGLENAGVPHDQMVDRVGAALDKVGMTNFAQQEPANLSGGQKQRVALAGVLAMEPEIIIMDEATSMLDPDGREEVMEVMRRIRAHQQVTILSITHDLEEAAGADRILVVREGQVFDQGRPEEIFAYGEGLLDIGLDLPFAEKLRLALRDRGIPVPDEYLSREGMVDWLCQLNSRM